MDHLHYGFWKPGNEVNLRNFKAAQENFVEFLLDSFPAGIRTVLDVGSGAGELAVAILAKGMRVDCLSPSDSLNRIAREKIGSRGEVFTEWFENFESDKAYDLVLFSESFQYVPLEQALSGSLALLEKGGYLLVADFFRRKGAGKSPIGGGHDLAKFYDTVNRYGFEILKDEDITGFTAPTLDLRPRFVENALKPAGKALKEYLQIKRPRTLALIEFLFRKKIKAFRAKYVETTVDGNVFKRFKSYRLVLMRKTGATQPAFSSSK